MMIMKTLTPRLVISVSALAALLLGGCVTVPPPGPSVMALPGTGKNFDQFRADDASCRQYADTQNRGATAGAAAVDSGLQSAAVGTAVGALAGAAIGGSNGAGAGAGAGLAIGALAGTGTAQSSAYGMQKRYDQAYVQCMYAKGHRVPVSGAYAAQNPPRQRSAAAPSPPPPPPPQGIR